MSVSAATDRETPELWVAATVGEKAARQQLQYRWRWLEVLPMRHAGPIRMRPSRMRPTLVHLEKVWMPYALVAGEANRGNGQATLRCFVDRVQGECYLLATQPQAGADSAAAKAGAGQSLPGYLEIEECRVIGERFLRRCLTARRSTGAWHLSLCDCQPWYYPFWIGYFDRRHGKLDVGLLDAVTGKRMGARVKRAFLTALRAAETASAR